MIHSHTELSVVYYLSPTACGMNISPTALALAESGLSGQAADECSSLEQCTHHDTAFALPVNVSL